MAKYEWLGNWLWTRLHAVRGEVRDDQYIYPICNSSEVFRGPQHNAARRHFFEVDTPKCKRCLKIIERETIDEAIDEIAQLIEKEGE